MMHYEQISDHLIGWLEERDDPRACWMKSARCNGAGRWLARAGNRFQPKHLRFDDVEYRLAMRLSLLLAPFEDMPGDYAPSTPVCSCEGSTEMLRHKEPFHNLDCGQTGDYRTNTRHNNVVTVIRDFLGRNIPEKPTFVVEPWATNMDGSKSTTARGDLSVHAPHLPPRMIDVMVTNPATRSYRVYKEHKTDLFAASQCEKRKINRYKNTRELSNGEFVPFVVEATGKMGNAAKEYVNFVSPYRQELVDLGFKAPIDILQGLLCTTVMKGNVLMLKMRLRSAGNTNNQATRMIVNT